MAGAHRTKPIGFSIVVWTLLVLTLVCTTLGCRLATPVMPMVTVTATTSTTMISTTTTPAGARPPATPKSMGAQVVLEGMAFSTEMAVTPQERARGLMERPSLGRDQGMLLIFEMDGLPGLWMRGMFIPLDFVWIDSAGIVAGVTAEIPPASEDGPTPLYYPPRPVRYVLEINAGLAEEVGIDTGSHTTFIGIP